MEVTLQPVAPEAAEYRRGVEAIRASLLERMAHSGAGYESGTFLPLSAALYNLMPAISSRDHPRVIGRIDLFQKWAAFDQDKLFLINELSPVGQPPDLERWRREPQIFCSFHLGSYRTLVSHLGLRGFELTLLIDQNVAAAQKSDFETVAQTLERGFASVKPGWLEFVDTAQPNMLTRLRRALSQGRSVFVYVDGNMGSDGRYSSLDSKHVRVNFLGRTFLARKGVGFLSYLTRRAIQPLLTYRDPDEPWINRLVCGAPMAPTPNIDRDTYVEAATRSIYKLLADCMPPVFEQWEAWRYVCRHVELAEPPPWRMPTAMNQTDRLSFDAQRFALLDFQPDDQQFLLFDRATLKSNIVGTGLNAFLHDCAGSGVTVAKALAVDGMSTRALAALLSRGVLRTQPEGQPPGLALST